jgi:hypothetical protein
MIAGRINVALIRAHWSQIPRIIASIRTGTVTASLIMRQLAAYPRQNSVAAALRELGRLERTLFTLDWISNPELRRSTGHELNKGEARNSLARAVFIHRLGELRPQPARHRHHPLEHQVSGTGRRRAAASRGYPRSSSGSSLAARLGARKPDRRLHLERNTECVGKH